MSGAAAPAWLVPPAAGQTLRPVITSDGPLPRLRGLTTNRAPPRQTIDDDGAPAAPATAPAAATPASSTSSPAPAPGAPSSDAPAEDGSETPASASGSTAEDAPRVPTGLRLAPRDGDLSADAETEQPAEGAAPGEPGDYINPDGADMQAYDARSAEDAEPFERPPAGYDQELFRAEIAPLLDRRPERLFRFEPWQPRGIRIGSFVMLPTVDVGGAALSNVFRSKPAQSDSAAEIRPTIVLRSDWRRHALELRASGNFT